MMSKINSIMFIIAVICISSLYSCGKIKSMVKSKKTQSKVAKIISSLNLSSKKSKSKSNCHQVIIQLGERYAKVGFGGQDTPFGKELAIIGKERFGLDYNFGESALSFDLKEFLDYQQLDDLEKFFDHIFTNVIRVNTYEVCVTLSMNTLKNKFQVQSIKQILTENLGCQCVYITDNNTNILLSNGLFSGLSVYFDRLNTYIDTIIDREVQEKASYQINLGENSLLAHKIRQESRTPKFEDKIDFFGNIADQPHDSLLNPKLIESDLPSIEEIILHALERSDSDQQQILASNIILSGELVNQGFIDEVKARLQDKTDLELNFFPFDSYNTKDAAWIGASIASSMHENTCNN